MPDINYDPEVVRIPFPVQEVVYNEMTPFPPSFPHPPTAVSLTPSN